MHPLFLILFLIVLFRPPSSPFLSDLFQPVIFILCCFNQFSFPYSCFFFTQPYSLLFLLSFHPYYILILEVSFQPSFLILCFFPTFAPYLSLQHSNLLFFVIHYFIPRFLFFRCNILTFLCCYTLFYSNLPFLFFTAFTTTNITTFLSCSSLFKPCKLLFLFSVISTSTLVFPLNLYPFLSLL